MYHRVRRKMQQLIISAILILNAPSLAFPSFDNDEDFLKVRPIDDNFENNVIDFDEEYTVKFDRKFEVLPWKKDDHFNKESHRYTVEEFDISSGKDRYKGEKKFNINNDKHNKTQTKNIDVEVKTQKTIETTVTQDYSVIPLELVSTTENVLVSIVESTTEDLTVIPLSTTEKILPKVQINQTVTLPPSTQTPESTTDFTATTDVATEVTTTELTRDVTDSTSTEIARVITTENVPNDTTTIKTDLEVTTNNLTEIFNATTQKTEMNAAVMKANETVVDEDLKTNNSRKTEPVNRNGSESFESNEGEVPIFTELDIIDESEVPEDYYDSKDIVPTKAPSTDALSVIFGLAGSVVESMVESVAERVVPKGLFDLFKRMQRQNEALESERLRSREENGGLGQFGRGILKSISSGIGKPLSQLMAGVRDIGSLDNDRGFVSSIASGVTSVANVANSLVDAFKDRVQAIYPGTVWCGDGHSATARSSDLGLFFFTDTCCRQHDACKLFIKAGETKYGLTNTGLFTRSHCSCDTKFRDCLRRTNSLVSAQIGLTYFNVLGPQCFRRAHPIIRCVRRTRITGQKCEEYELDYTKPKMWQWFDSETF